MLKNFAMKVLCAASLWAVALSATADAVVGLWHGIATISVPVGQTNARGTGWASLGMETRSAGRYLLFLPDGTYTSDIPNHGVDAATLRAGSEYQRGQYRVDGQRVTLLSRAQGAQPETLELRNGVLHTAEGDLQRRPNTDGIKISGTFSAEPSPSRWRESMRVEPMITFGADGRFSDRGALFWVRRVQLGAPDRLSDVPGDGHYEVANNTVTFRYDDSRVVRVTLYFAEPTAIGLATARLERKR